MTGNRDEKKRSRKGTLFFFRHAHSDVEFTFQFVYDVARLENDRYRYSGDAY